MKGRILFVALFVLLAALFSAVIVDAQGPKPGARAPSALAGTAFTYQGQLKNGGVAVNGTCDIIFALYDAPTGGSQIGYAVGSPNPATVTNGLFTVQIDFGSAVIKGDAAWLLPVVRCPAGSGSFVNLDPRQPLTPAPMALALPGLYTKQNATSPNIIGGHSGNVISDTVVGGTISGGGQSGYENKVWSNYGTIGGGSRNTVSHTSATISGGTNNTASGVASTISGGYGNTASGHGAVVGGGGNNGTETWSNVAEGHGSTIGGGLANTTSPTATHSTIAGGYSNNTKNDNATVGGGWGNTASGEYATVSGGYSNLAAGNYSFAAGSRARANHVGAFVWADSTATYLDSTAANQFLVRATGGISLATNSTLTTGCKLAAGSGTWSCTSNKNAKANFVQVDGRDVLARVNQLPITMWNYKTQDATIRHIGPMAQDFSRVFGVGENDTTISMVDADGVALAAIQGLAQENQELKSQISNLESRLAALEQNAQATNPAHSNNLALIVVGVLLGIVVAQRMEQRGER